MIRPGDQRPYADVIRIYGQLASVRHGVDVGTWPLLRGWNYAQGTFRGWMVVLLQDAPFAGLTRAFGLGELDEAAVGAASIDGSNREEVRRRLGRHLQAGPRDAVILYAPEDDFGTEYANLIERFERVQGLTPMKVFLSHKGVNKPRVRQFKGTLELLGFDPWLDEDSLRAGANLERGLLQGFSESCAAVFFVTPQFRDESFLATEVDYAVAEKRRKGGAFAIVTIVFDGPASRPNVPELLRQYVWKEPAGDLEALREIVAALPIRVGGVVWR